MRGNPINIGYSTCPNDTFIFRELAKNPDFEPILRDVETLNQWAFEEKLDVTKLSFHTWLLVQEKYALLSAGAALGRGCGPLVIAKEGRFGDDGVSHLHKCEKIAVPGEHTTAHLLLRLWNPDLKNRIFMPFDQIMDAVESGAVDAGVIIHEGRFVYQERGFERLQDLGEWWEAETGCPIPLGCIAAKKSLGAEKIAAIDAALKHSIQTALADPDSTKDYVKKHARELSDEVTREHIKTYVNEFTLDLGDEGRAAVAKLQALAEAAGIISNE